jgi:excisionase family DNA binding protein
MRHEGTPYSPSRTPLLDVNGLAQLLGISRQSVYRMIARRELVPYRIGERLRFRPEEVDAYLERQREGP